MMCLLCFRSCTACACWSGVGRCSTSLVPRETQPTARLTRVQTYNLEWNRERPERGQVMCIALQLLQKLVLSAEQIGEALVPYYRQARRAVGRGTRVAVHARKRVGRVFFSPRWCTDRSSARGACMRGLLCLEARAVNV